MPQFPPTIDVSHGTVVRLHPRRLLLILRLTGNPPRRRATLDTIRRQLAKAGLRQIGDTSTPVREVFTHLAPRPRPGSADGTVNHSEGYLWVEDILARNIDGPRIDALTAAMGDTLDDVAPVYRLAPGVAASEFQAALLPRVLLVEPQPDAADGKLDRVIESAGGVVDTRRSRYLGRFRHVTLPRNGPHTAFSFRTLLLGQYASLVRRVCHEQMPLESPLAFLPDDEHYTRQWNMEQIHATRAWDVTRGAGMTVAVLDSGCERSHPDLTVLPGLNVQTMVLDGSPVRTDEGQRSGHGTRVAGVIGARINNATGIAGLAGDASILPIATSTFSDVGVAMGIRFAVAEGARVINMSFATPYISFWTGPIPDAIDAAVDAGCVLCAAAGNADRRGLIYPALHPRVMAVGGCDPAGERWRVTGLETPLGSHYGDEISGGVLTGVSVVAPATNFITTDLVGSDAVAGPFPGYQLNFDKTSAATPHVSALAALVMARFPSLTSAEVRRVIEQSAEKVGSTPYAYMDGFFNGTRNEEMGYGRVHAFHALRVGDVFIRDWPGDMGDEPSAPPGGNFFSRSDIVLRPADVDTFLPDTPAASVIEPGRDHVIAVRVTSRGPAIAHGVEVDVRVTPFVGLEFHYPDDWRAEDAEHIRPAALTAPLTLDAGTDGLVTFALSADEVARVSGWTELRWHPCVLAVVTTWADDAFDPDRIDGRAVITRFNNLAQRNLSVIRTTSESIERLPFVIGHPRNDDETAELIVEADARLAGSLRLWNAPLRVLKVSGGQPGGQGDRPWVDLTAPSAKVILARTPGRRQALVLETRVPRGVAPGESLTVHLRQMRRGTTLGGATVTYVT